MKVALVSLEERAIEWFAALCLIWFATCVLMPGDMLSAPRFAALLSYRIPEKTLGVILLICGTLRLLALFINGRRPSTPYARVAFAIVGVFIWMPLAKASFTAASLHPEGVFYGLSSVGAGGGMYFLLGVFEIFSVYRAMSDSRYLAPEHRGLNVYK